MLSPEQLKSVSQLAEELSAPQLAWLSGYIAGLQTTTSTAIVPPPVAESPTATVLYGSQTGNSMAVGERLAAAIRQRGLRVDLLSMGEYKTARLKKERFLFAVISTHGEGEPPDSAIGFFAYLNSARAPKLPSLSFSILALGDSSYEHFCQAGRDMHAQLQALGATPLTELAECDLDFDRDAGQWCAVAVESFAGVAVVETPPRIIAAATVQESHALAAYNRQNPFSAPVLVNLELSAQRQTRHLELSLEDSDLSYRPGDSLGVWPRNAQSHAEQIAAMLGLEWDAEMHCHGESTTVSEWLLWRLDTAMLTPVVLESYRQIASLPEALRDDAARAYLRGRGLSDLLGDYPPPPNSGAAVLGCLRQLAPRLYSLASSMRAREDEAHILATRETYTAVDGSSRVGVCSAYLFALREGDEARVYIQRNDNFRLPDDNAAAVIMIGPGTGIAPFRAFMEEREERGGGGRNWLFFGERYRREDFYYQTEWQSYLKSGALSSLDVAFSRDHAHKVYVQNKMLEQGNLLWEWLQDGAHLYVCGDEKRMARDVHDTLRRIVETNGSDGDLYLNQLRESGRYQRDVY